MLVLELCLSAREPVGFDAKVSLALSQTRFLVIECSAVGLDLRLGRPQLLLTLAELLCEPVEFLFAGGLGGELLVGAGAVAVEVLALARQFFAELGEPIGVGVAGVLL